MPISRHLREAEILIHPASALLDSATRLHLLPQRKRLGYAAISASLTPSEIKQTQDSSHEPVDDIERGRRVPLVCGSVKKEAGELT